MYKSRRDFLSFMGATTALASLDALMVGCSTLPRRESSGGPFQAIAASTDDAVRLAPGLTWERLISYNDPIKSNGTRFGYNNDYIATLSNGDKHFLWVNHENPTPFYLNGWLEGQTRTYQQVRIERGVVGGSCIRIEFDPSTGACHLSKDQSGNFRLDGMTPISFSQSSRIRGKNFARGTIGNCAGGVTPWGTFLTCEENYDDYFVEAHLDHGQRRLLNKIPPYRWQEFYDDPAEHYGWVVEVHPQKQHAVKHVALGRFAHECATVRIAKDGRAVVYMGDDGANRCFYKFISSSPGSLEYGDLYVANLERGEWLLLNLKKNPALNKMFSSQLELLTYARQAAIAVGATPLDRPEDIEIQPGTGHVFLVLTNNIKANRPYGSILKIVENNNDPLELSFQSETFVRGGAESGFACPDNLIFDPKGNLWMTTDIAEYDIEIGPYKGFGNNSLFYIPLAGDWAGQAFRVATAPKDAEFTGPCFTPNGRNLLLSVQHPGLMAQKNGGLVTSHWPHGGDQNPLPSVIQVSGPLLTSLTTS